MGPGSKVPHLTYLGDTSVGSGVNIGAGTITCNYDGKDKHRTVIEDGAFIGSNCNLVAPVKIGAGAYVAAGSTITTDVPPGALGVARNRQRNIPDWVQRRSGEKQLPGRGITIRFSNTPREAVILKKVDGTGCGAGLSIRHNYKN